MNLEEKLLEIKRLHQAAGFYTDPAHTDKFAAGFVSELDSDFILIESLTPNGMYDGYILRNRDSVYRVDVQGDYESQLAFLAEYHGVFHKKIPVTAADDLKICLLQFALKENKIISVELHDSGYSDVIGFVKEYDDTYCSITRVNGRGQLDGTAIVTLETITKISCDGEEERKLAILNGKK